MVFNNLSIKPRLIVFDLDCTLWPFDCDDYSHKELYTKKSVVYDGRHLPVKPYPFSEKVLRRIKDEPGIQLAIASMTSNPKTGHRLLDLYNWRDFFDYVEIYPVSKTKHFTELQRKSNIPFHEMMFFDDMSWNISEVGGLGVHANLVHSGVDFQFLRQALEKFANSS